jgi:hypothetical protein
MDAIRLIGSFAAHPMESQRTGEIMDVEPGEADWTIRTLDGLFDFCFVAPPMDNCAAMRLTRSSKRPKTCDENRSRHCSPAARGQGVSDRLIPYSGRGQFPERTAISYVTWRNELLVDHGRFPY